MVRRSLFPLRVTLVMLKAVLSQVLSLIVTRELLFLIVPLIWSPV